MLDNKSIVRHRVSLSGLMMGYVILLMTFVSGVDIVPQGERASIQSELRVSGNFRARKSIRYKKPLVKLTAWGILAYKQVLHIAAAQFGHRDQNTLRNSITTWLIIKTSSDFFIYHHSHHRLSEDAIDS